MPHVSVLLLHPGLKSSTFNCLSRSVRTPTAQPVQLKSQPPTARQACQHAAHEKPSASVREACHKGRLLSLHLQIQDGGASIRSTRRSRHRESAAPNDSLPSQNKKVICSPIWGKEKGKKNISTHVKKK